jgi:hypothetical protein
MTMASQRRTIARAISRNPYSWRDVAYKYGENRNERRHRAKKTREQQKKDGK